MVMASSEKELQQQLMEAGTKLLTPPSSVDELLPLLDQIENCLAKVEQSPSKSMLNALAPSLKALVTDKIFKHSDVDVKVAVACCISEITRITAPEAPYDDDLMKDVFQLIVSSFENLSDKSSRSYNKRTSILETVAKVRSCVVMLDLECDELIIEMFQHFLSSIRDYHPDNVVSSMETIMSLVLEESEDISVELLSPLLAAVKKGNEEALPIARKLGEKVLETCANKVKPYLQHAVKSLGISLDDYGDVVASICQESSGSVEQNDAVTGEENKVEEGKPSEASPDEAAKADKERAAEAASPKLAGQANDKSPKSVVSNGVAQTCEDESLDDSCSLRKQDDSTLADPSNNVASTDADVNNLDSKKSVDDESKPEAASKKRGRKVKLSIKLAEPSESSNIDAEKSAKMPLDEKSIRDSEPSADDVSGNTKEGISGSEAKLNKRSKKGVSTKDSEPSADDVVRKISEGISDSEEKVNKKSSKKTPGKISNEEKTSKTDASKKKTAGESETKSVKKASKKEDLSNSNNGDEASLAPVENKKQRSRGKSVSKKNSSKGSTKDDDKVSSPKSSAKSTKSTHQLETPKTDNKRKHASSNEKGSETRDNHADDLVGKRVKVYWPQDKQYYKGTIYSYIARTKRHEVVYDDGDKEILNMNRQKWEFIEEDDVVEAVEPNSPDAPTEMPPKKKARTGSNQSAAKHGKADPAKGEKASSSKSKSAPGKSAKKSKDSTEADDKSTDDSKPVKTTEDETVSKIKSGSKSADVSKSKSADTSASKSSKKAPIAPSNSNSKSSKSTGKSSKPGSKVKEIVDDIGDSTDSDEPLETVKAKSKAQNSSKGSEGKSGKKRRKA